jgi:hypothetical protein
MHGLGEQRLSPVDEWLPLQKKLRQWIRKLRQPRRVELSVDDSEVMRRYVEWREDFPFRMEGDLRFHGIPLLLNRPETMVVRWDEYEQLKVLSATCFTPDPKR